MEETVRQWSRWPMARAGPCGRPLCDVRCGARGIPRDGQDASSDALRRSPGRPCLVTDPGRLVAALGIQPAHRRAEWGQRSRAPPGGGRGQPSVLFALEKLRYHEQSEVIHKILTHLALWPVPAHSPPVAPRDQGVRPGPAKSSRRRPRAPGSARRPSAGDRCHPILALTPTGGVQDTPRACRGTA